MSNISVNTSPILNNTDFILFEGSEHTFDYTENNNTGNIERYYSNYESGRCLFKITLKEYNDYTLSALIVDKETKDERSVPLVMISVGNNSFTESDMLKKNSN